MSTTTHRLPRQVVPVDYDVHIDASPRRRSFHGEVVVTVLVNEATDRLELNARGLKIGAVSAAVRGKTLKGKGVTRAEHEVVELRFPRVLPRGRCKVTVAFRGGMSPSMHGLYLARDGRNVAVVSQCEAADARAIFPCFDEPDLKATLRWSVTTDAGLTVVTNGALQRRTRLRGKPARERHVFKRTAVIPTYLAALTIGELEATRARRVRGVPCRVLCAPGKLAQTHFAQEVTAFVLPWYEDYFGQKYNYKKLDQVAVPGFDAGAMENVGAIFYRQQLLLMSPESTTWATQKRIAEVIAHEIAHQWFGNLVTMKWWDDLWLNEAFATWIAYKVVDLWQPKWRMWDDFLDSKESALAADSLVSTHPIYSEVHSPAQATELFDVITYEKGCAVLRMAERYLGDTSFRRGIQRYQAAFKNGNARGADLWSSLKDASGEPVDAFMQSWVSQPGFPLLNAARSGDGRTLILNQRRFFAGAAELAKPNDQIWIVPVTARCGGGSGTHTLKLLMNARQGSLELPPQTQWVFPNADAAGFYRTQLDDEALGALLRYGLTSLTPAERLSLLEDEWWLVRCGRTRIERFMDVLVAYAGERDHVVIRAMVQRLASVEQYLTPQASRARVQELVRWLFEPHLAELGWQPPKGEDPARAVRRAAVVHCLGEVARTPGVLRRAEELLRLEQHDPEGLDANLAAILPSLAAIGADTARVEELAAIFTARQRQRLSPDAQLRYLHALGAAREAGAVQRVLAYCLDGVVPQEQLRSVMTALLAHRESQLATWAFLKRHWQTLSPRVGSMGIARLVEALGALPHAERADLAAFFAKHPVPEAKRALDKAMEAMQLRHELIERSSAPLAAWLERQPWTGARGARDKAAAAGHAVSPGLSG